jgi:hypothetical protein
MEVPAALADWMHEHGQALEWLGIASLVGLVATALLTPYIVKQIPEDYFARRKRSRRTRSDLRPASERLVILLKNAVGVLLLAAGSAMMLLPGPGVVTILLGVVLIDFPGKYKLERAIVKRPAVLDTLNAMRARAGAPPLRV